MSTLPCHRCGSLLAPGEGNFYVVRIEAFAEPTPPDFDDDQSMVNIQAEWERLLNDMRDLSEQELMDQVYRRLTIHLCASCYKQWIDDPTG